MLELVFMRMLSDSRLFDIVGNPKDETNDLPPLVGYVPQAKQMYEAGHVATPPKTQIRHFYASHLFEQAILFLVGHEIAHITLGHVDYLKSKAGAAFIIEMGWNESDPEGLIERQCLEAQADMRSVFSGIESLQVAHATPNLQKPVWADSIPSEGRLIFDWALAMNSLFRLFGDAGFNSSQLAVKSYPPLPLRRAMATFAAYGAIMENWDPALKEKALHSLRTGMKYTEYAFATILGENIAVAGLMDAFSPLGKEHHKRLFEYSFELQKRLAPFSYEKMFAFNANVLIPSK